MNRPIIKSNKTEGNTAFLSEKTQNAIYEACESLERHGVEFTYAIKNGEYSNGDFSYTYNGERKMICWQPCTQSEEAFLNEVKSALFGLLVERDKDERDLNRFVFNITESYSKSVVVYAETPEQAEEWLKRKYRNGEIKFNSDDFDEYNVFETTKSNPEDDSKGLPSYTAPACLYEVHEIEDPFTGEPATVDTCEDYSSALKIYNEIDSEGKPARLLKVDYEGDPIEEIKSNY